MTDTEHSTKSSSNEEEQGQLGPAGTICVGDTNSLGGKQKFARIFLLLPKYDKITTLALCKNLDTLYQILAKLKAFPSEGSVSLKRGLHC